jgi:hypothetical protein
MASRPLFQGILFFIVMVLFMRYASIAYAASSNLLPLSCQDSDGNCNVAKMNASDGTFESVDLLTFPYGWINATSYSFSLPQGNSIDSAKAHILWKTDAGFGASNVNVDYWNGTAWLNCAGPLPENSSVSDTVCNVSSLSAAQINGIQMRFRSQDGDGFPNTFGYVDSMKIEVNYSAPPVWDNQSTNATGNMIFIGGAINLSAQLYDDIGLSYAWLSTNESGQWRNYTPVYLSGLNNTWTRLNFSWRNDSVLSGSVSWKIFVNDTTGKENATNGSAFFVQFRMVTKTCQDSDGNCNVAKMNASDGTFESVDLLTFPYGWINITSWNINLTSGGTVLNAKLHALWKTDTGFGVSNVNLDYWNGTAWVNCAGSLPENSSVSDTTCDLSSLNISQINGIKTRFRGQDIDGFPNAFGYVDFEYVEVNYTTSPAYLEVRMIYPNASLITNVIQNTNIVVNATVVCRLGSCGNVNATLKYNLSSANPETEINTTAGGVPFYSLDSLAMKSCPTSPLTIDEFCNITWTVNSTGGVGTGWKIGALFNSSDTSLRQNQTENSSVSILPCSEDFNLDWQSVEFGSLNPSTGPNSASGNANSLYNITVNPGSCNMDFYVFGTNLTNDTYGSNIHVMSILWSNASNDYASSFNLTESQQMIKSDVPSSINVSTWYWINVPPVFAGFYTGTLTVRGVKHA